MLHVWMFAYGDAGRPARSTLAVLGGEMRLAVPLFFLLSGFLIYRPFVSAALDGRPRPSLRAYALHRAARVLPAYWVALAVGFWLLRWLGHPLQATWGQLPIFLAFAQNHFEATAGHVDPPMWTLGVEASFYALLPVVATVALRLGPRRARQVALCVALVGAGMAFTALAALGRWPATITASLPAHLAAFGSGMAVAAGFHGRTLRRRGAWALIAGGLAMLAANSAWHALALGSLMPRRLAGDVFGVWGMALIVAALTASTIRVPVLTRGPIRWLGSVSYGMYLAHFLVIVGLRGTGRWPDSMPEALVRVLAWTLPLAAVSHYALERPVMRWVRGRTAALRHRRAVGHGGPHVPVAHVTREEPRWEPARA